jgi:hypothetical protein
VTLQSFIQRSRHRRPLQCTLTGEPSPTRAMRAKAIEQEERAKARQREFERKCLGMVDESNTPAETDR